MKPVIRVYALGISIRSYNVCPGNTTRNISNSRYCPYLSQFPRCLLTSPATPTASQHPDPPRRRVRRHKSYNEIQTLSEDEPESISTAELAR